MLLDRHRIVRAALDRCVVADDHAVAARYAAYTRDDPGAMDSIAIHAVCGERRQLQKRGIGIKKPRDPFTRQELATRAVALPRAFRAALSGIRTPPLELRHEGAHGRSIGSELGGAPIDCRL